MWSAVVATYCAYAWETASQAASLSTLIGSSASGTSNGGMLRIRKVPSARVASLSSAWRLVRLRARLSNRVRRRSSSLAESPENFDTSSTPMWSYQRSMTGIAA